MRNVKTTERKWEKKKSFITVLSGIIFLWGEWWGSSTSLFLVMGRWNDFYHQLAMDGESIEWLGDMNGNLRGVLDVFWWIFWIKFCKCGLNGVKHTVLWLKLNKEVKIVDLVKKLYSAHDYWPKIDKFGLKSCTVRDFWLQMTKYV